MNSKTRWQSNYKLFRAICVAICIIILLQKHNHNANQMRVFHTHCHAPAEVLDAQAATKLATFINVTAKKQSVKFAVPGLYAPMKLALDLTYPVQAAEEQLEERLSRSHASQGVMSDDTPRLLVAVTTACCQKISTDRRKGIRDTWVSISREMTPNVDVVFFVAQARNASVLQDWAPKLEEEVRDYDDIVVVRGADRYRNFFNKTFRMLQYALAHPAQYTHVLKSDDDTWVRPSVALRLITAERLKYPMSHSLYAGCLQRFNRTWFRKLPKTHKWYLPEDDLPESALPKDTKYAIGFGYILSADLIEHVVFKSQEYFENESSAPVWFRDLKVSPFEDILIAILVQDVANITNICKVFQDVRYPCSAELAVRHLGNDSPSKLHNYVVWHEAKRKGSGTSCPK